MSSDNEASITDDMLAAFVDRILRLKSEADDIAADIKEIYAEAHGNGLNKTRLGEVVTHVRKHEKDATGEAEKAAIRDLYLAGYYRSKNKPHAHAYARGDLTVAPPEPTGQVADIQPETANDTTEAGNLVSDHEEVGGFPVPAAPLSRGGTGGVGRTENEGRVNANPSLGVTGGESAATNLTTFIPKPLRPYCLNTDKCGGQGRKHCWSCQKAHDEAQGAA